MARPLVPGSASAVKPPGELLVVKQFHVSDRNMDQRVPIAPAGLDQDHASSRVLGKSVGQNASGRPGTNDDVIRLHLGSLTTVAAARGVFGAVGGRRLIRPAEEAAVNPEGFEVLSSRQDAESAAGGKAFAPPCPLRRTDGLLSYSQRALSLYNGSRTSCLEPTFGSW